MTSSASAHVLRNFVTDKTTHSVIYDAFVRAFSWSVWIRWKVLIVFVYLMLLLLSYCVNDIIHLKKSINTVSIQYWYMYRSTGDIEMQWFIWRKKNSMRAKPPIIFDAAVLILLKWLYDIRLKKKGCVITRFSDLYQYECSLTPNAHRSFLQTFRRCCVRSKSEQEPHRFESASFRHLEFLKRATWQVGKECVRPPLLGECRECAKQHSRNVSSWTMKAEDKIKASRRRRYAEKKRLFLFCFLKIGWQTGSERPWLSCVFTAVLVKGWSTWHR